MAEQHLYRAQIRTVIEQMRRESVAQSVRRQRFADVSRQGVLFDGLPKSDSGHRAAGLTAPRGHE